MRITASVSIGVFHGNGAERRIFMTSAEYKDLSVKEFTKAAEIYESDHASVYNMCKKDYPDILAELEKEPFTDLLDCGCGTARRNKKSRA